MSHTNYSDYLFIIDTDSYSGNFEREMTAFMTGAVGECGVGGEYADMFKKHVDWSSGEDWEDPNNPFNGLIEWRTEAAGCSRPCVIYETTGRFNDGMGGHYSEGDDMQKVAAKYAEYCKKHGSDDMVYDGPGKWPAYESVAILMNKFPTDEQITMLKDRAYAFPEAYKSIRTCGATDIKILGFRIVEVQVKEKVRTI